MSSGMMPAQFYLTPDSYQRTNKSEVSGTLTNLPNIAGTWGKFIPTGWGNYRIGGYQIWSSPFYKITDTSTVSLVDNWQFLNPSNLFQSQLGMQNVFQGAETYSERVSVDVAYSFGYNGLGGEIKITRIRFDQNPIYDITSESKETDYAFTVRYGNEDYPEPVMVARATDPENVVYYPGQIVITFAGLEGAYLGTKNTKSPLPTSIDIDVRSGKSVGQVEGIRTDFPDSDFEVPFQGSMHNNWKGDYIYVYAPKFPGNGEIQKWKLSTLTLEKTVPITVLPENSSQANDRFAKLHMSRGMGLLVGQFASPGNYGAIYLIDPETGQQVYKYGQDGWATFAPYGSGYPYADYLVITEDTAEAITITGANTSQNLINTLRITKGANGYTGALGSFSREGFPGFADAASRGDNGTGLYRWGTKLYKVTAQGMTLFYEDARLTSVVEDFTTVGDNVFIAFQDDYILIDKDGNIVYEKTPNDDPNRPGNAFGWSNTAETNRQLQLRKPGSVNYVGAWTNVYTFNINMLTGEMTWTHVVGDLNVNIPAGGTFYDPNTGKFYQAGATGSGNGFVQLSYTAFGERILLQDFIRSLYVNTGKYTSDQIQFVDIEDTIVGALLVKPYPLDTIVNNIIQLYRIEKLETRDSIKFYRNRPIIGDSDIQYDIDLDNLALVREGDDSRATLITTIGDTQKGFAEIKLTFIDYEADYNENSVVWRRPDAPADATQTLNISTIIIMDKNEAQQLVQINFQDKISATTKHQLRLPPSYSDIYKGDILRVKHNKYTSVMRVTETTLNADHSVSVLADGAMLSVNALPPITDKPNFTVGAALGKGPTVVIPLDTNAIHPTHNFADGFAYYYLVYGTDPEWAGGYVTRSNSKMPERRLFEVDGSVKFAAYETVNALGDKPWTVDEEPLQVTKIGGRWDTAKNTTVAELAKDKTKNLCFYGAPGRWEIMQVAAIIDGKATGIFRGMRGTESFCGLHVPGDKLLVIDEFLIAEKRALDNVGITDTLKSVSYSERFEQASGTNLIVKADALKPFAPVFIEGATEGEDVVITWARRDRTGGSSFKPIPMSEATEEYEIDIIKGGNVLRTVTDLTDKTFTYTSAMRVEDETANDETLTLAVYQISAVVGRGYAGRATINV